MPGTESRKYTGEAAQVQIVFTLMTESPHFRLLVGFDR